MTLVINGHRFAGNSDSSPAFHLAKQYREAELSEEKYAVFTYEENGIKQISDWVSKKKAESILGLGDILDFILKMETPPNVYKIV